MKLSFLLIMLGGLLCATTMRLKDLPRLRKPLGEIFRDAKNGELRSSGWEYARGLVGLALIIVGMHLALKGQ